MRWPSHQPCHRNSSGKSRGHGRSCGKLRRTREKVREQSHSGGPIPLANDPRGPCLVRERPARSGVLNHVASNLHRFDVYRLEGARDGEGAPVAIIRPMAHPTILVVDDEPLIRWSLTERLRSEPYEVLEAETGKGALDQLQEGVDLVLLDYRLPDT